MDQRFGQTLAVLSGGSPQRSEEAIGGIRDALAKASEATRSGLGDIQLAKMLARESQTDRGETSGRSLGHLLVAMIYEARAIGTRDAMRLASQIQEAVSDAMARFPAKSTGRNAKQQRSDGRSPSDSSDEILGTAVSGANVLRTMLQKLDVYSARPAVMLRPHAMGYLWGWCDATVQLLGVEPNSGKSLGIVSAMFVSFYEINLFNANGGEGSIAEALKHANKLRESGDPNFNRGLHLGGQDLYDFVKKRQIPERMVDVFF